MKLSPYVPRWLRAYYRRLRAPDGRAVVSALCSRYGLRAYQVLPFGTDLSPDFISQGIHPQIALTKETPVASMGSCFAREIKYFLLNQGYTYVQTEHNQWSHHSSCAWERVYTIPSMLQIFQYSLTQEVSNARLYAVGSEYRDLMRYRVAYKGTREVAENDLHNHVAASHVAISQAKIFILTIGQNEQWVHRETGMVLAQRPDERLLPACELRQNSLEDNLRSLIEVVTIFKKLNPSGQLILTLSPVPSTATFFDTNIVQRSFYNKALLRIVIDEVVKRFSEILYFPSYEIVASSQSYPFERDNIHVRPEIVARIMRAFIKRC
jgi:hypothetical protein